MTCANQRLGCHCFVPCSRSILRFTATLLLVVAHLKQQLWLVSVSSQYCPQLEQLCLFATSMQAWECVLYTTSSPEAVTYTPEVNDVSARSCQCCARRTMRRVGSSTPAVRIPSSACAPQQGARCYGGKWATAGAPLQQQHLPLKSCTQPPRPRATFAPPQTAHPSDMPARAAKRLAGLAKMLYQLHPHAYLFQTACLM